MMMMVVVVVVRLPSDRMSAVAAGAYIFQPFEAAVRLRISVQLEIEVFIVAAKDLFERLGGAVRAFGTSITEVLRRWSTGTLADRAAYRYLRPTSLATRGNIPLAISPYTPATPETLRARHQACMPVLFLWQFR